MVEFNLNGTVSSPPIEQPTGHTYQPQALSAIFRTLMGNVQVTGVCHNTDNSNLTAIYNVAHLAARHAISAEELYDLEFLEVGTWCGESAVAAAIGAMDAADQLMDGADEKINFRLTVVDTFVGSLTDLNQATARHFCGSIENYCCDNLRQLDMMQRPGIVTNTCVIKSDSVAAAKRLFAEGHQPFDYIFIDAGHTEEECAADIEAWFPLVRPGGFVAGHDYDEKFPGVILAADRLCKELCGCVPAVISGTSVWFARKPY